MPRRPGQPHCIARPEVSRVVVLPKDCELAARDANAVDDAAAHVDHLTDPSGEAIERLRGLAGWRVTGVNRELFGPYRDGHRLAGREQRIVRANLALLPQHDAA